MSWPKAFVRINGTTRTATIWGFKPNGFYLVDGKIEEGPLLATEIEFPYGRPDDWDWQTQIKHAPVFVPLKDVVSMNWECINFLERSYGVTQSWLREQGVKFYVNGYGADVKKQMIDDQDRKDEDERRSRFSRVSPGVGDRKDDI